MVITCCAPGCRSVSGRPTGITFHRFPRDPARRRQWALALRREDTSGHLWVPSKAAFLCRLHFTDSCIDATGQTVRIRDGAVPSVFEEDVGVQRKSRQHIVRMEEDQLEQMLMEECHLKFIVDKPPHLEEAAPEELDQVPEHVSDLENQDMEDIWDPDDPQTDTVGTLAMQGYGRGRPCGTQSIGLPPVSRHVPVVRVHSSEPDGGRQPRSVRVVTSVPSRGRLTSTPGGPASRGPGRRPAPAGRRRRPANAPPGPLRLPPGRLTAYMNDVTAKRQQMQHLEATYQQLQEKVQFRNQHPDWADKIPEPAAAPLLTLRDDRPAREPYMAPVDPLSADTLLPLSPEAAWAEITALRLRSLELQVALMYSRIQVKYRELRLQEVTAEHRRFKAGVREQQRLAQKEDQSRELRIRQLERRCSASSAHCTQWRLKTREAEKKGNKKKRRSEQLVKGLEDIFTPMQLRVIRSGKKPRWTEEDIRRAIELKKLVSRRGYSYIRNVMKIPLPSPMIMRRGANRFAALKPLYEQMVAANLLKYSTKKKRPAPKEARPAPTEEPVVKPPVPLPEKPPVKRQKKSPPPPPAAPAPVATGGLEVEFEALSHAVEMAFACDASARPPAEKRGRRRPSGGGWPPDGAPLSGRGGWDCARLIWEDDGQTTLVEELPDSERRSRPRPSWRAEPPGFL